TVVIRRALEDLPVLVAIAAWDLDESRRLEDEVALRPLGHEPVGRAARDDDVVAVLVRDVAERRLERPAALVDEDDLVAFAVPEEVVHGLLGPAEGNLDVVVPHEGPAAGDLVALGQDVVRVHAPVRMRLGNPPLSRSIGLNAPSSFTRHGDWRWYRIDSFPVKPSRPITSSVRSRPFSRK